MMIIVLNVLVALAVFRISSSTPGNDERTYWMMGESILHGKFSSWYFLPKYYPETLRTPGYPVFLALCQLVSSSTFFVKLLQLLMYFVSIILCLKIIGKSREEVFYKSIFVLLVTVNPQIVFYSGVISAELPNVFMIVLAMYIVALPRTLPNALLLAVFSYCAFIIRPAFLLFPVGLFFYFIIENRKHIRYALHFITLYVLLLIPFGIWNKINHGIFKVTCVEGGAGVAHIGFWLFKLPDGYIEKFYWGNSVGHDAIQPKFFNDEEKKELQKQYEAECRGIFNSLDTINSAEDSIYLARMQNNDLGLLPLHNSRYTIERERALWAVTIKHIKEDPLFYLKTRLYILARCYFTGLDYVDLGNAKTLAGKLKVILPFAITFTFIFLGLLFITFRMFVSRVRFRHQFAFLLLFWYYGFIHMPFTIQGRYTVPVHMLLLMTLSLSLIKKNNVPVAESQ
jgi:hypothetical protein